MEWRHWLLLGRLINGHRTGTLFDLYDLEYEGYAVFQRTGDEWGWHPTANGMRAYSEAMATTPSWERFGEAGLHAVRDTALPPRPRPPK